MALDPFTTLGLVANVLQFVELAGKLMTGSLAVYRSHDGASENVAYLLGKARDVGELVSGFKRSSKDLDHVEILLADCKNVAEDLESMLKKVQIMGKKTKWKSFKATLKEIWSQDKINNLSAQLTDLQLRLNTYVNMQMK